MRDIFPVLLTAALALGACDRKTEPTLPTDNVATAAADKLPEEREPEDVESDDATQDIEPGKWVVTTTRNDRVTTGRPDNLAIKTATICLTPKQAAGGPDELLKQAGTDCALRHDNATSDTVADRLTCQDPAYTKVQNRSTSSFTSTSFVIDQDIEANGPTRMSRNVHIEGRRVGSCDAR